MFTIGEFARLGRVSVRMLRHYDGLGLLRPARVDPHNGYRLYDVDQLHRLNRTLALKDLGFTLEQVRAILDESVDVAELRAMLRLRRAQLTEQITADADRLARVEARLRLIEREGQMTTEDVTVASTEPIRIAALSGTAPSYEHADIGPAVGSLFAELGALMSREQLTVTGPAVATYAPNGTAGDVAIRVGLSVAPDTTSNELEVVDLPGVESATTLLHQGTMDTIGEAYQTLAVWIDENGYRTDGTAREVYLVSHPRPQEQWETQIQMPVRRTVD